MVRYKTIASHPDYIVGDDGSIWSMKFGKSRRLKPESTSAKRGIHHQTLSLCQGGIISRKLVHRLVLEAFVGPCPEGLECRHIDGNAKNNRLFNLKWGTKKENGEDRVTHETSNRGEAHGLAKLTAEKVRLIRRELVDRKESYDAIAKRHGVSRKAITRIRDGICWSHLED